MKIVNHGAMVGLRWVGCCVVLALSCGRTESSDRDGASAGSPPTVGGTGSGGAMPSGAMPSGAMPSGSGPVSGEAGEPSAPDCPVTPVAGEWVGIGADPYGFAFSSDGSHLNGEGCLAGLPSKGDALLCSPLAIQADRGRRVAFVWDMKQAKQNDLGIAYVVKMELTLAPDRSAMAGTVWTSPDGSPDGKGQDIVLVRNSEEPLPPATVCSGGEPSGACFLRPLRADRIGDSRVVELGGGSLLLVWMNQRAGRNRIASARFDAAAGAWQEVEFLDDGSAPVDAFTLAASPGGWAMLAYRQGNRAVARAYDRELNAWSEQQLLATGQDASSIARDDTLLVYDGGDATLIASTAADGSSALSARDYVAKTRHWESPENIAPSPASYDWAAASDSDRNQLVIWIDGEVIGEPYELWFSKRSAAGTWTGPALFHTSDQQIVHPAVTVGKDGNTIATWQEWTTRIASSFYSFNAHGWSAPLTITPEHDVANGRVELSEAGAFAYFHRNASISDDAEQRSQLNNGVWGAPQTVPAAEADDINYSVAGASEIKLTPLRPRFGNGVPTPLGRPRCEGY